jgi:hypothetical protein
LQAQQAAPKVTVNLDLPPRQRWSVLAPFAPAFGPITAWLNKTIPAEVRKVVDPLVARVDDWLPQPYADELRGVADLCAQYGVGIDLGEVRACVTTDRAVAAWLWLLVLMLPVPRSCC